MLLYLLSASVPPLRLSPLTLSFCLPELCVSSEKEISVALIMWQITVHNTMDKLYLYELIETRKQRSGLSVMNSFVDCNLNIKVICKKVNYFCRKDKKKNCFLTKTLALKYVSTGWIMATLCYFLHLCLYVMHLWYNYLSVRQQSKQVNHHHVFH